MSTVSLKTLEDGIGQSLKAMISRARNMQGFLNRVVYKEYQNAQRERWISENDSEGTRWKRLTKPYSDYKKTKFASYPGSGNRMLVATGRLYQSVIGPSSEHYKLTTSKSITIGTRVPYAKYVDEERTFTTFGEDFGKNIGEKLAKYLLKNQS